MLTASYTSRFKKDYKRCMKQGLPEAEIQAVVQMIMEEAKLPSNYKEHLLKGEYAGYSECHIRPDWLLIWRYYDDEVSFVRTGSHTELFD